MLYNKEIMYAEEVTDFQYRLMFWEIQGEHRILARSEYIQDCVGNCCLPFRQNTPDEALGAARCFIERFCKKHGYKLTATKPNCYATGRPNPFYGFEITLGRTPRPGTVVKYISGGNKEYVAVVTGIPPNPDHSYTDLPTVSLAFQDYRGKGIKKERVIPASDDFVTKVWKPIIKTNHGGSDDNGEKCAEQFQ